MLSGESLDLDKIGERADTIVGVVMILLGLYGLAQVFAVESLAFDISSVNLRLCTLPASGQPAIFSVCNFQLPNKLQHMCCVVVSNYFPRAHVWYHAHKRKKNGGCKVFKPLYDLKRSQRDMKMTLRIR